MELIQGIQNALDYIEAHLAEEIDYDEVARRSCSSLSHFRRTFHILCGYTLAEYIRNRRLSLAATELTAGMGKVIDIATKYGYESPDSFAKAFQRFHGIPPSQAGDVSAVLKFFSPLSIRISLEGGTLMNYRMETKPEFVLTGFKTTFAGDRDSICPQDHEFTIKTRLNQYILEGLAHDCDTSYEIMTNFTEDGYDFYIASKLSKAVRESMVDEIGEEMAARFEHLTIPETLYLVCETERCKFPVDLTDDLRHAAVTQWLPVHGYELTEAPEIRVTHWFYEEGNEKLNSSRYCEVWLPITKI